MRRLFMLVGVLMIIGGILGNSMRALSPIMNSVNQLTANIEPTAKDLCNSGETLESDKGASTYTQGQGYGRSVQYYCVNNEGVRRDVTGAFVQNMMGGVGSIFGNLGGLFSSALLFTGLTILGVLLVIIGAMMGRRKRMPTNMVYGSGFPIASSNPVQSRMFVNGREIMSAGNLPHMLEQAQGVKAEQGQLAILLKQLDDARQQGLISQMEYEQKRQELLKNWQSNKPLG